jgi:protein-tyrosine phosphatase
MMTKVKSLGIVGSGVRDLARLTGLIVACTSLGSAGCGPEARVTSARVEAIDSGYRIEWTTDPPERPVDVYVAERPDATLDAATRLADGLRRGFLETPAIIGDVRHYFLIDAGGPDLMRTATRVLPLEGGRNFRDLGGYETADGRRVRWGRLFRSGAMARLTPSDYEYLSTLGIRVICDLRSRDERGDEPTNWQADPSPRFVTWDAPVPEEQSPLIAALAAEDASQERVRKAMAELYRLLPYAYVDRYRDLFGVVASGDVPLAFHCSAGKDRAGVAAALLLTALGVPRETVVQDYAMSDKVVDYMALIEAADPERVSDASNAALLQLPRELLAPILWSDPLYIVSMFDELEANHGSVMAFIHDELGMPEEAVQELRDDLLE